MLSYVLPLLIGVLVIAYTFGKPLWRERQRKKIGNQPFNKHWRAILKHNMPYFRRMPTDLQLQLKQLIQIFLSEKQFVGCEGVRITDEIRVTVAAQACLLLLNRKTDIYPKLQTILVYPSAFVKEELNTQAGGVLSANKSVLAGESWDYGKVVLSWQDTLAGAEIPDDGRNLVIHEFAHQLDQEKGSANGAPILGKGQDYESWSRVFNEAFSRLQRQAQIGEPSLFDYYGATNPAEFFAVASEVFFEQAVSLSQAYPELYRQLAGYYRVDPLLW